MFLARAAMTLLLAVLTTTGAWAVSLTDFKTEVVDEKTIYLINNKDDLENLAAYVNAGNNCSGLTFKLNNPIYMTAVAAGQSNHTPIGNYENYNKTFRGTFDGNNKIIDGMTIYMPNNTYVGLFGYLSDGAVVKDLTLTNCHITGNNLTGGIAGKTYGGDDDNARVTIENCHVSGENIATVDANYHGGIVGQSKYTNLKDCTVSGTLSGISGEGWGGILGYISGNVSVTGCENAANITLTTSVTGCGGIVGSIPNYGTSVSNCLNRGTVSAGSSAVGAICGNDESQFFTNCYYVPFNNVKAFVQHNSTETFDVAGSGYHVNIGKGTAEYPYLISSSADWDAFVYLVENYNSTYATSSTRYKLTADISVTTMVGTETNPFRGKFDGSGHTLTVNYTVSSASENYVAPFRYVGESEFKNLHTAGTITINNSSYVYFCYASGLIYKSVDFHSSTITKCWSSVDISYTGSSSNSAAYLSGFIASPNYNWLTFTDCRFDGNITVTGTGLAYCSSYTGRGTVNKTFFNNCLMAGTITVPSGSTYSKTFYRNTENKPVEYNNSYYTQNVCNSDQGTAVGDMTVDELATQLGAGWTVDNGKAVPAVFGYILLADNAADNSNSTAISNKNGETVNVMLDGRTLYKDGEWNTICLPFNVDLTDENGPLYGAIAKTLTDASVSGTTVSLTFGNPESTTEPVTTLKAGTPYIIKWDADLIINSDDDWVAFADAVAGGNTFAGKLVRLGADVNVSKKVGTWLGSNDSGNRPFCGIFDGNGHTLTLALDNGNAQGYAPFSAVQGATIMNVNTTGTVRLISDKAYHASGLVGFANGVTIQSCHVSADIQFPNGTGTVHSGGIIGHALSSSFTMTNCLFDGSIGYVSGGSGTMTNVGGLVGWSDASTPNITSCLNAGSFANPSGICKIARGDGKGRGSISQCYSTTDASTNGDRYDSRGTYTTETGSVLRALLGSGWQVKDNKVVPVIGKYTTTITNPMFNNVTIKSSTQAERTISMDGGKVKFIGYYDAFPITSADTDIYYISTGNQLQSTGTDRTLNACRAYFQFNDGNNAREIVMKFAEDETTGIQPPTISPEGERAEAFPREGLDGVWYTVDGRKLSGKPTRKGLYIFNGKKTVIK